MTRQLDKQWRITLLRSTASDLASPHGCNVSVRDAVLASLMSKYGL